MPAPVVERPSPSADRPRVTWIAVVGVTCFVVGWLAVRATLEVDRETGEAEGPAAEIDTGDHREERVESHAVEARAAPTETPASSDDTGAPPPAREPVAELPEPPPPSSDDDVEATPSAPGSGTPVAGSSARERAVRPGRIAYLRCDGAPRARGPYPCPRDLDLEAAAWTIIDTLPACVEAPRGAGESDVRITFRSDAATEVSVRDPHEVGALPERALLSCLAPQLAALHTSIRSDFLVVSFRFALVER